jgi:hypothetical protein
MSLVAMKREARRRRILENIDQRLDKITGKYKEKYVEGKVIQNY